MTTTQARPVRPVLEQPGEADQREPDQDPGAADRPSATTTRPARHASRNAMSANPTGRASWPTHAGTFAAMIVPVSRSVTTSWTAPHARIVAMQAATAAANTAAARRSAPGAERAGREREQLAFARGDRGAEEADPQREVLNEGTGAGDADAEQPAHEDFEQRQRDHRGERQRGDAVFDRREQRGSLRRAGRDAACGSRPAP